MTFTSDTRVHIVGVGGAGMSGVARLLHERGCIVTGSDASSSDTTRALVSAGIPVVTGDAPSGVSDADVVLWSPAVALSHPLLQLARERGATLLTRAALLEELGVAYDVVGLTGTHGKTTATSMMVHVMEAAGRDASWLLGADVLGVGSNGHAGRSTTLVLETDESYGTFAALRPAALGVLNVEADHLDHYGDLATLEQAFVALLERTRGPVVVWCDDEGADRVAKAAQRPVVTVGTGPSAEWRVSDMVLERRGATFSLQGADHLAITLQVTGAHNVANAAVVAVLAHAIGIETAAITAGLAAFRGAPRRFEFRGVVGGADVYEDYAHLPREIEATLAAARAAGYLRVIAVFQPHRFTRTLAVGAAFAPAFDGADEVFVTDIYAAGEDNPHGLSGGDVATWLRAHRHDNVRVVNASSELLAALALTAGDALFFIGAGDIGRWADEVVNA